jgi:hypothetical protein
MLEDSRNSVNGHLQRGQDSRDDTHSDGDGHREAKDCEIQADVLDPRMPDGP